MSNAKQETITDIVAEMRQDIADGAIGMWSGFRCAIAKSYANHIAGLLDADEPKESTEQKEEACAPCPMPAPSA